MMRQHVLLLVLLALMPFAAQGHKKSGEKSGGKSGETNDDDDYDENADDPEFFDIFKTGKKQWRLAFRGTANIGKSVFKAYKNEFTEDVADACKTTDWTASCNSHYRNNDALDNFAYVEEVAFAIIRGGVIEKTVMFSGAGHDYMSWFSEDNYDDHYTCYHDLRRFETNYFGIRGHEEHDRRFYINRIYAGCPKDEGWFVAIDGDNRGVCDWEKDSESFPIFKYSTGPTVVNWNGPNVGKADAIAVFLKYRKVVGVVTEYTDVVDSGVEEWRLAFRGSAGVGSSFIDAFKHGRGIPNNVAEACKSSDWSASCNSHYRNEEVFGNWGKVQEVLIAVVANGGVVKTVTFNVKGSSKCNWFHQNRLVDSCWADLQLAKIRSHFFMRQSNSRHFFINHQNGHCDKEEGWLVAVDDANDDRKQHCDWSKSNRTPKLMYAAGPTRAMWNDANAVREADAFVVYVRYGAKNKE